ncbi:MAG TPA: hypothetical protein VHB98_13300 [Chloroflexota bacterium]|nr:hypothetical protein [Chloroflexota bacterium]
MIVGRDVSHRPACGRRRVNACLKYLPLICLLAVGIAVACRTGRVPVYSIATVQAGLAHHPSVWVGRTVHVRGVAALCLTSDSQSDPQYCSQEPTYLVDAIRTGGVLPLAWGRQDAVRAFLRRVPLVRAVVAPPQTPRWWLLATYWVQLRATATGFCGIPPCYEALLLDAAPESP